VVHRSRREILGCHIVGERAVDICQVASVAIAARMKVPDLVRISFSYPTYAGVLALAAARAAYLTGSSSTAPGLALSKVTPE
jgi:dihydrolipoamide dehydrogenase